MQAMKSRYAVMLIALIAAACSTPKPGTPEFVAKQEDDVRLQRLFPQWQPLAADAGFRLATLLFVRGGDDLDQLDIETTLDSIISAGKPLDQVTEEDLWVPISSKGRAAMAVLIDISGKCAHARLRLTVFIQRDSTFQPNFGKRSVLIVAKQEIGGGIIGDINVDKAVIIEVQSRNAKTLAANTGDAALLACVCEAASAFVVIEDVAQRIVDLRCAIAANASFGERTTDLVVR